MLNLPSAIAFVASKGISARTIRTPPMAQLCGDHRDVHYIRPATKTTLSMGWWVLILGFSSYGGFVDPKDLFPGLLQFLSVESTNVLHRTYGRYVGDLR